MDLNKYGFYSANVNAELKPNEDKIDTYVKELMVMDEYQEVCDFIKRNFGEFEKDKLFDYPELNKQVFIDFKEDAIEFFAAKNQVQFFSKGWKMVEQDN